MSDANYDGGNYAAVPMSQSVHRRDLFDDKAPILVLACLVVIVICFGSAYFLTHTVRPLPVDKVVVELAENGTVSIAVDVNNVYGGDVNSGELPVLVSSSGRHSASLGKNVHVAKAAETFTVTYFLPSSEEGPFTFKEAAYRFANIDENALAEKVAFARTYVDRK